MTSSRRRPERGVRRWIGLLVVSVAASALAAPLMVANNAAAAPLQADLRLTGFAPVSVVEGKTVRASGTFTTNKTIDDVTVRFEIGDTAFFSRSAITEAASTPPFTYELFGASDDLNKVRRGETKTFRISFPSSDLPFFAAGVYPMKVTAVDSDTGEILSSVSSFLPWAPEGLGNVPSRLLMFWPVIGDAELTTADGGVSEGSSGDATDRRDDLLQETLAEDTGRLATLVESGSETNATWVLDPALLEHAAELDTPAAEAWLADVAAVAATRRIAAVPYGDPDVAAVGAAGRPGFLLQGQSEGDQVFRRVLEAEPRSDLAWPADGAGDEQTITTSARAGDDFVLMDGENAPLVTPETYTPSGRISWPDPEVDVLLADEAASALVATPATTPSDVLLARQRFLAETYLHSLELNTERLLVIAPPRRWDPSPAWASELVDAIGRANWLDPVSMDEAVEPSLTFFEREAPSIPEDAADRQLPSDMVLAAQQGITDNRRLAAILTRPRQITPAIEDRLLTSVSTAWRADPAAAEAAQAETLDQLRNLRGKVRIVSQGGTLADDRGSFPITLRNQLDQPVVVRLSVTTTDQFRLRVDGPDGTIRIAAQGSTSRIVELDAVTSGRMSFDAQLRTPGDAAYSEPVTVTVDVRGFGQITLVVFGVAVGLLVLAAAIRIFRRIRNARRASRQDAA